MKSKKVIVLLISLTLLVSMTLPGRVVVYADQAADSGHRNLLSENEEKDTSPVGAGDPDSSGVNQSEDPPEPSGAAQSEDSPEPSGAGQSEDPPVPSGANQSGDSPVPSGPNQSGDSSAPSGVNQSEDQSVDPSQPEEPGNTGGQNTCTCGAAQGKAHGVECPLYVPADVIETLPAKVCTCGREDGTHDENCPLYVAPEGLEEEEEESDGASLTVSVQVSGEDQGNAVLNLTGPEGYCKRIVVHGSDSVTLSGLGAGAYTVSGGTDPQSVTLEAGAVSSVDITVARSSHGWLTGEAYQKFTFGS